MKGHIQIGEVDSAVSVLDNKKNSPRGIANMQDKKPADKSRVTLYRQAEDLSKEVEQESIVDSEKVNLIKAAIANGTYLVNPAAIAEKLLELEIELTQQKEDSGPK